MQQILQDDGLAHRVRTHEATFSKTSQITLAILKSICVIIYYLFCCLVNVWFHILSVLQQQGKCHPQSSRQRLHRFHSALHQ